MIKNEMPPSDRIGTKPPDDTRLVRARLKRATDPLHDRLNALPALTALLTAAPDAAAYGFVLERFYGLFVPLERDIFADPGLAPHHPLMSRRQALEDDLRALGRDLAMLDEAPDLPDLQAADGLGRAGRLGALYVLQGSRLGGAVIGRNLVRSLSIVPRFFDCTGDITPWRVFCALLEDQVDDENKVAAAEKSAQQTFAAFLSQLKCK